MLKKKTYSEGFSLIELIAVLLIVSIVSAVAIPYYSNERARANLATARQDGDGLNREILATVQDIGTLGTTNGNIAYDPVGHTVTITLGAGATSPSPFSYTLSKNTTAQGITYANTSKWCFDTLNTGQHVVYTDLGQSSTLTSCGATSVSSNHFLNASLEADASNWSICYNPGVLASTLNTSSTQAQVGVQSLLRTVTTGTGVSQMNICGNIAGSYQANEQYTFSVYVYSSRAHSYYWALALNAVSGTTYPGLSVSVPANTWTLLSYTATMPSDFLSITNLQLADSPVAGDLTYVDNAQSY